MVALDSFCQMMCLKYVVQLWRTLLKGSGSPKICSMDHLCHWRLEEPLTGSKKVSMKSNRELTRGRGLTDSPIARWALGMLACMEVVDAIEHFNRVGYVACCCNAGG